MECVMAGVVERLLDKQGELEVVYFYMFFFF
jgi:hypothetical protein